MFRFWMWIPQPLPASLPSCLALLWEMASCLLLTSAGGGQRAGVCGGGVVAPCAPWAFSRHSCEHPAVWPYKAAPCHCRPRPWSFCSPKAVSRSGWWEGMGQELRAPEYVGAVSQLSHFALCPPKPKHVSSSQQASLGNVSSLAGGSAQPAVLLPRYGTISVRFFQGFFFFFLFQDKNKKSPQKSQSTGRSFPGRASAGKMTSCRQPKPGFHENILVSFSILARALSPSHRALPQPGALWVPGWLSVRGEHQLLSLCSPCSCGPLPFGAAHPCPAQPSRTRSGLGAGGARGEGRRAKRRQPSPSATGRSEQQPRRQAWKPAPAGAIQALF